jgi:hypothetical protein
MEGRKQVRICDSERGNIDGGKEVKGQGGKERSAVSKLSTKHVNVVQSTLRSAACIGLPLSKDTVALR